MTTPASNEATRTLCALSAGDNSAAERLMPLVYSELRALAGKYFRIQNPSHTLQPTALVHEAFVRLIDQSGTHWNDRAHFFAVAATAMRQILTDHARRRRAAKRGGGWEQVNLDDAVRPSEGNQIDMIALDECLAQLAEFDARKHRVVELRFFGGLTVEEVSRVMDLSKTTVESEWRAARAWLNRQLSKG